MSRFQKVLTVLFCIIVLFALAPTGGAFAQTEGPFGDPTCGDYIDNDGDGNKDSADTDCYNNVGDPDVDDDGDGRTENAGDCNDDDPTIYSGALKICDGKDNNCDGKKDFTTDEDKDNDGVPWCAGDCDDNNPNRAPNIIEAPMGSPVCLDGIDNDCDNKADSVDPGCQFSCFDSDGDGYGINGDASCDFPGEIDCNDNDATINPGQTDDSCNGIDNNCSTVIDDEYVIDTLCGVGECLTNNTASSCVGGVETLCIPGSSSPEGVVGSPSCTDGLDNDCDGLSDTDPACQVSCQDFDEDGYGVLVDASCQFAGIDCDDSNALINPGGDDANCNGIDEDCVGGADSGYAVDSLCGTGECQTNNTPSSCTGGVETLCQPGTPVAEDTPGVGVCIDGVDNDCDGLIDTADSEGCSSLDVDDDGDGFTENQNDCNDADATIYPGAPKICDGKDNNCDGKRDFTTDVDADLDGVPWCAGDCDDNNPNRAPNLFEGGFGSAVCTDGIDNDCDNKIDFADPPCQGDCIDTDGDGYGVNGDVSCDIPGEIDCDDTNAAVNPAGDDANCNGIDEDCVGGADSGYVADTLCGTGECQANNTPSTCVGGVETACQPGAPVLEGPQGDPTCSGGLDEDCDDLIDGNDPGCNTPCIDQDGDGYGANGDPSCPSGAAVDCDDSNAAVNPAGDDANCNGIDEDCAGGADDGYIPDTDCGTGECQTNNTPSSCTGGVETACEPGDPGVENTPFVGACIDGLDNDCDGLIDALPGLEDPDCFDETIDNDGDGYCKAASCTDGSSPNDCDDTDPNVYPGAPKICDGKDSNCDGKKDSPTDEDKDLDGVPWCAGDCDDNDPLAYPGNTEGPFGDPTCSDGRDNDCQNGADAVDPACVVSCETSNDTKDGLHVETMRAPGPDGIPNTADDTDHPESNNLLCGKCHGATLQDPIRYACDRCHEAGGTSKAAYPDPWPFGFGSAPDVMVHSSTVVGTKYGAWDMDCLTCHNPHLQEQDSAYGTSYGKYIKEYICFDNPVTAINVEEIVEFTAPTGPGSFADGPPLNENICNMCHTQTNHHRRDDAPPAPGGQDHNNGQDCAGCHPHIDGFAPSGGEADAPHNNIANPGIFPNCSVCHVSESDFLTPVPSANCLNCHDETAPNKAGGGSDIKVRSHFIGTMECIECHNPMFAQINFRGNPNLSHVRTVVNGNQIAFEAKTGPFSFADDTNAAANGMLPENYICNTCHTATAHHRGDGSLLPADQSHNDGIDCTGCHTHQGGTIVPDAFRDHIENSQAHAPHNNTANPGLFNTCDVCHVTESDYVTPVPNTKCLNCHSVAIGQTGPVDSHHTAGDGSQCIDCHNPMREQINFRGNPNLSHIRTSINGTQIVLEAKTGDYGFAANGSVPPDMTLANYVCNTCHTQTNHHQADGTAPLGQSHNNGLDCTLCHTHPGTAASGDAFRDHPVTIADQPHNSTATPGFNDDCNLCHVDNVPPLVPIPNSKCNGCHAVGTPDQAGGGADTKLETHHTPVDSDCVECHNPMGQTGGNAYHIRLIVNGEPIVFTGVNDYAAGDGTGLCEVCHTSNTYYVNAANQPAQFPDHNVGSNCTTASCHTHETGMEPPIVLADAPHDTITDCTLCHDPGTYVDGADIDKAKCYNCHGPAGPATTVETHHTPADLNCTDCHNPMNPTGNWKHVKPTVDGATIVFGTPTTAPTAVQYADEAGNGLCEVCHDSLTLSYYNSDGSGLPHNAGAICTTCHTHPTGFVPPSAFADVPHETITDCTLCHDDGTYVDGATLNNTKCLGCHGPAGPATTVETHHTPADLNCTDCHNPMNVTGTWKHVKPTVDGSPITFGNPTTAPAAGEYADGAGNGLCEVCHDSLTLSYYNSDGSGLPHMTDVCTTCHTHDTGMVPPITPLADVPHNTITDCTQCHSGDDYADGATLDNNKCLGCHGPAGPATTVETHHTPADLNCTDCHNPMNVTGTWKHVKPTVDGTLITFGTPTTAPAAGEYADGAGNGLCEVCHDSLTLSYYNSDGSGLPHMTDVCTICHTHDTGMVPPTTPLADVPHDTITDCTQCHSGDDYADGATLDNNKCLGCHGAAGPATTVETHHTPADLNCTDCHNPMNPTGNWKHVKPTVDGSPITFGTPTTAPTAVQYADEAGNGLCEVCHDAGTLSYYNSDGSGLPHNAGAICTTCHTHPTGFVPPSAFADVPHETITDCTLCHDDGTYVDGATLDNNKCLGCHGPAGPATTVETHHTPADLNCTDCHNPMNVTGTWKHVKPTVDGSPITFGNPTTAPAAGEYADGAGNGLCEVCHDSLTLSYYNSDGSGLPHMTDVCTTCHTHDTGMVPPTTPLADVPHDTITDCTQCHSGDDYADGATLDNNKCLGCHGPAGPATTVETHHTPADLNCTDCHNPMNATGTWRHIKTTPVGGSAVTFGTPTTAPSAGEYADGLGSGLCEVCHTSLTLDYYNSDGSGFSHNDGSVCTSCHTHDTGMAPPIVLADTPHDGITDCTLCHDPGTYVDGADIDKAKCYNCHGPAGPATTVETHHTPADLNCTDCHNPMNPTGNWKHVKPTVDGSTIVFGTPTTAPTAIQYADEAGNGLCEVCHDSLTLTYYNSDGSGLPHNAGAICTTCHTHPAGFTPSAFADVPHDGITDCTLCHDPGTYVDGATLNNSKCLGCHGPAGPATTVETHHTPADLNCTDCHNPMNVTGTYRHIKSTVDGATIVFGTPTTPATGGEYADGLGNGLCEVCHDSLTLAYYNSDGSGFSHNDGSVCTSCHTHDTGMVPPQPPADTPHDTITDCTLCHDPGTYVDDATLDNNKCLGCHGPAGPATTVETHHTPPDLNCTDCHNPMNPQGSNLSHIRTSLANFTANAAGADFADGSGNGICETCHVGTKYYNQTGTGQPHETDACTNCHMHLEGFVQPDDPADAPHNVFTDCSVCHTPGSYVLNAAIPNSKCNNCHAVGTPDAGAGGANTKVETHHTPADEDCVTCHNPMRSQGTNLSHIRTSLAVFTANAAGADFANGTGSGICETCHVSTTYYNNTGTGQPHFTDACTNCHLHEGGFVPVVEADAPHDTIPDCYYCHVVSGFSTPIPDSKCEQCHTPDGVLKDSYPSAPDVLTHSSVNHPTGSAYTYTNNCIDCHNPMYAQDGNAKHIRTTLAVFTGADYIHSDPNYDGICETCHVNTRHHRNAASQPAPIMPHNNTIPCTNCHAHEAGFIPGDAPPPPHVTQPCGTCHVTPDTYVLGAAIPNSACLSCHDLAAPGSHIIGWGDCRTESGTTDLSAGMSVRNVSLTTPISNTSKAFLLVDSSGPQSTIQGRDHMVSGYIAGTNTLTFEREGNSGIAEVSYAVVECLWDEFTVQRGEIQLNNGIASNTATISDVDPAMSMVIVNARTNIAKEEQHQALVTGKMLDQTTVEVERAASATSADTSVRYEVVEFSADSGVKIQTGEIDFNGDSSLLVHVPTPVLKESSWLYFSYDATDDGPQENAISGQLTTINRLSFYRHENSPFDNRIRYYLVEFPEQQVLVQRGVSSYQGGASQAVTHDITIPTPVSNLDKAFTFVTNTSAGRGDTLNIDPNGTFIEAENYTNTLPGAGLITETIIGGELHGGTSLVTSGGANLIKCDDIIAQNQAGIEYNVNFTTPGTYTIWMRGNSVKFTKDSHAVGFYTGTEPAEGCIAVLRQNQNRRWTWSKSTETHSAPGGVDIGSAQFTVSAPGTYKLRVWIAENGHYLDGIYIDSINSVPTTSNHGIMVDSTDPQAKLFPRNRWTEQLTSTSNIRMSNWRGETEEADADFDWQVIDFVGSPRGDSGSDMKVDRHFSDNYIDPSTGSLMDITCVECHNPMRPQSNLKFIRSTIRSNTVNFTSFYEMAGDSAPYDGVCEVCHTQTLYHRNDGTETDSDHGIGSDCRWCHKHRYGQKPVVVPAPPHDGQEYQDTCTLCHVNDINYSLPIPDSKCNACHTLGGSLYSSYPTAQIVVTHASANNPESPHNFSITCVDCHLPMWEVTNLAQIRTRIADSIVPGSDVLFTSLTGTDSFADGPPYEENICDTCHSQTNHHQSDGTAPGGQSHNDGLYCAGCHPHGDGFLYSENNCVYCHNQSPPFTSSDTDRRQIVEFIPGDGEGEFVKRSHHVINGATVEEIVRPDDCRVCHDQSNHQQFGDGQTVLVNDPDNPGVSHTYDGTGKSIEVFCLGCHDNDDSQVYGPQPFIGAGDINNPPQIGWETDVVSHSVAYTNAACFNCHGDETGAVNGHGSANPYMHKYTYVPGESHLFCYNCHDGSLNNPDVRAAFDLPFSHRTGSEECKTCHDQHKSEMGLHVEGSENLADMIGGVNKGMGFDYQYEICFQCHDIPITKTNLNSENDMDVIFGGSGVYATYWSTMPDVQSQFSTDNLAYHPLFAAGLNQPSNSLNSAWDTSPYRKDDSAPGGPFDGLDNNFVDNWKSTSLVTCSDCHGNGTVNGARGIHGSDYPWLNRRVETDKKVTTAGAGVIFPNVQGPNELHTASNFCVNCHRADIYGFGSANAEPPVWQNDFSRIDHSGSSGSYNRNCKKANIESSKGGFAKIGCSNCHGGSEVAGIHGTNLTATGPGNRQLGERFMNGNSRAGQVLSGNSVSCYATTTPEPLNVQLSSCNQHRTKASQPVDFQYSY